MNVYSGFVWRVAHGLQRPWESVRIELLVRDGCHLCEDALRELTRVFGARNIRVIDIVRQTDLEDEFVFRIPVVRTRGVVLAEGVISSGTARSIWPKVLQLSSVVRNG